MIILCLVLLIHFIKAWYAPIEKKDLSNGQEIEPNLVRHYLYILSLEYEPMITPEIIQKAYKRKYDLLGLYGEESEVEYVTSLRAARDFLLDRVAYAGMHN